MGRIPTGAREVAGWVLPGTSFTVGKLIVLIVLVGLLIYVNRRVTRWLVESLLARRHIDLGVRQAIGTIVRYALTTLGFLVILDAVGIDLSAFTVLVGALGVGLGFGLQNVASNFVSGIIILFERPIKVGDRIEIGGVTGEVRRIASRSTFVVTDDNVAVIVPNSQFVSERVTNWSHTGDLTAFTIRLRVAFSSDVDLVRRLLLDTAAQNQDVLEDPKPEVELVEVGAALHFTLQVWSTKHIKTAGRLKSDLNFAVWKALTAHGIEPPPPFAGLASEAMAAAGEKQENARGAPVASR